MSKKVAPKQALSMESALDSPLRRSSRVTSRRNSSTVDSESLAPTPKPTPNRRSSHDEEDEENADSKKSGVAKKATSTPAKRGRKGSVSSVTGDNEVQDEVPVKKLPATPARRGRKGSITSESTSEPPQTEEPSGKKPGPARRGRKGSTASAIEDEDVEKETAAKTATTPGRRGRKGSTASVADEDEKEAPKTPARRGRKGSTSSAPVEDTETESSSNSEAAKKKTRSTADQSKNEDEEPTKIPKRQSVKRQQAVNEEPEAVKPPTRMRSGSLDESKTATSRRRRGSSEEIEAFANVTLRSRTAKSVDSLQLIKEADKEKDSPVKPLKKTKKVEVLSKIELDLSVIKETSFIEGSSQNESVSDAGAKSEEESTQDKETNTKSEEKATKSEEKPIKTEEETVNSEEEATKSEEEAAAQTEDEGFVLNLQLEESSPEKPPRSIEGCEPMEVDEIEESLKNTEDKAEESFEIPVVKTIVTKIIEETEEVVVIKSSPQFGEKEREDSQDSNVSFEFLKNQEITCASPIRTPPVIIITKPDEEEELESSFTSIPREDASDLTETNLPKDPSVDVDPKVFSIVEVTKDSSIDEIPENSSIVEVPEDSPIKEVSKDSSSAEVPKDSSITEVPKESSMFEGPNSSTSEVPKDSSSKTPNDLKTTKDDDSNLSFTIFSPEEVASKDNIEDSQDVEDEQDSLDAQTEASKSDISRMESEEKADENIDDSLKEPQPSSKITETVVEENIEGAANVADKGESTKETLKSSTLAEGIEATEKPSNKSKDEVVVAKVSEETEDCIASHSPLVRRPPSPDIEDTEPAKTAENVEETEETTHITEDIIKEHSDKEEPNQNKEASTAGEDSQSAIEDIEDKPDTDEEEDESSEENADDSDIDYQVFLSETAADTTLNSEAIEESQLSNFSDEIDSKIEDSSDDSALCDAEVDSFMESTAFLDQIAQDSRNNKQNEELKKKNAEADEIPPAGQEKPEQSSSSFLSDSRSKNRRLSGPRTSIQIHENVTLDNTLENTVGERIQQAVDLFCTGINKPGEINVSLEFAEKSPSDSEDKPVEQKNPVNKSKKRKLYHESDVHQYLKEVPEKVLAERNVSKSIQELVKNEAKQILGEKQYKTSTPLMLKNQQNTSEVQSSTKKRPGNLKKRLRDMESPFVHPKKKPKCDQKSFQKENNKPAKKLSGKKKNAHLKMAELAKNKYPEWDVEFLNIAPSTSN